VVETSEKDGWKVGVEEIEKIKVKNEKIKILILNNGGNPTGVLYTKQEIKNILAWAKENNVIVISDEVYSGLAYDGAQYVSCGSFPEYAENVVVIQSCSKHFAMTGWRVGLVFGPEEVIEVLKNIQSQSTTGTSSISQWAAVGAFENAGEIIPWVNGEMKKRRDVLCKVLKKYFDIEIVVNAGLYAFVSMSALGLKSNDSVEFCKKVLEEANVAMVPGAPFGAEGYVRLSFGEIEDELIEAMKVLKDYLKKH
jgi:aspartate/methionine/tyrosine aminotransferase